jgi:ABC-2 type transport system ATP-binding protein
MTSQLILELNNVAKSFKPDIFVPRTHSLKGVSLGFPEGRCSGLVGHNGAGKTTTIRLILGLTKPDHGGISFRGESIQRKHRAEIGYMAESVKFPAGLSCYEILRTHLALFNTKETQSRDQLIKQKLEQVGLGEFTKRMARSFSKGMQQRLAWAQATIHEPKLLILDEPFSGLDPLGRMRMKNWILEEKKKGRTIILCTHELPQITSLCDHIHILRRGELVYSSAGETGKDSPLRDLPRYFIDVSGPSKGELERSQVQQNLPPWKTLNEDGYLLRIGFSDYGAASPWLMHMVKQGWVIVRSGDDNSATEEQLLVHFKEEFSQ